MVETKPNGCPFCGAEVTSVTAKAGLNDDDSAYVKVWVSTACGCFKYPNFPFMFVGTGTSEDVTAEALRKWNRRHMEAEARAVVDLYEMCWSSLETLDLEELAGAIRALSESLEATQ